MVNQAAEGKVRLLISSLAVYEFWSGKSLDNSNVEQKASELFDQLEVVDFTPEMAKKAGELTWRGFAKGLDAMIAAVGLVTNSKIVTLNVKHFEEIPELVLWK